MDDTKQIEGFVSCKIYSVGKILQGPELNIRNDFGLLFIKKLYMVIIKKRKKGKKWRIWVSLP